MAVCAYHLITHACRKYSVLPPYTIRQRILLHLQNRSNLSYLWDKLKGRQCPMERKMSHQNSHGRSVQERP